MHTTFWKVFFVFCSVRVIAIAILARLSRPCTSGSLPHRAMCSFVCRPAHTSGHLGRAAGSWLSVIMRMSWHVMFFAIHFRPAYSPVCWYDDSKTNLNPDISNIRKIGRIRKNTTNQPGLFYCGVCEQTLFVSRFIRARCLS